MFGIPVVYALNKKNDTQLDLILAHFLATTRPIARESNPRFHPHQTNKAEYDSHLVLDSHQEP